MPSAKSLSIYKPIKEELNLVRADLVAIAEEDFPGLAAMLAHALKSIGKGTRPAITILSSKFHDHDPASPRLMACAVELLHIATLVHDDTIDKAAIRRGQPTISNLWGDNAAVLVGDYLFAKSATFVCATENVRVIRLFSETIMYLSRGELQERLGAFDWTTGRDDYYERIRQKTASLFHHGGGVRGHPQRRARGHGRKVPHLRLLPGHGLSDNRRHSRLPGDGKGSRQASWGRLGPWCTHPAGSAAPGKVP